MYNTVFISLISFYYFVGCELQSVGWIINCIDFDFNEPANETSTVWSGHKPQRIACRNPEHLSRLMFLSYLWIDTLANPFWWSL